MKMKIIIDENLLEDEIIIKCKSINKNIQALEQFISNIKRSDLQIIFYKKTEEYYFNLDLILFFETSNNVVYAHTTKEVYEIKYRLYELEKILPQNFTRISKSTIININKIFSINKNITSSSLIEFYNTYKQVYVSRMYFKNLSNKMKEGRNYEKEK